MRGLVHTHLRLVPLSLASRPSYRPRHHRSGTARPRKSHFQHDLKVDTDKHKTSFNVLLAKMVRSDAVIAPRAAAGRDRGWAVSRANPAADNANTRTDYRTDGTRHCAKLRVFVRAFGECAWQPEESSDQAAAAVASKPPGWESLIESLPTLVLKPRTKWQRLRLSVLTGDFRGLPDPHKVYTQRAATQPHAVQHSTACCNTAQHAAT